MMNIIIRTDSSLHLGTGHVMRCLTLADQLKKAGADVSFICATLPGNIIERILEKGYPVHQISPYVAIDRNYEYNWEHDSLQCINMLSKSIEICDWIIVDHYFLDAKWEHPIRKYTKQVMVIDDLANRHHYCDLLLDQNFYHDMDTRYNGLVNHTCNLLLSPKYALLRPQFYDISNRTRHRDGKIKRILVSFGGTDPTNETEKTLNALRCFNENTKQSIVFDVIVGSSNPNKNIKNLCMLFSNVNFYCQVNNMAEHMANADLAICAGGTSSWERCFLSLPAMVISVADNQIEMSRALASKKASWYLGHYNQVTKQDILNHLNYVLRNPELVKLYGANSNHIVGDKDYMGNNIPAFMGVVGIVE